MRLIDLAVLGGVLLLAFAALVAVAWRSVRRERRGAVVDLTDLTALSRSADVARPGH
jgi:hypothetical protein